MMGKYKKHIFICSMQFILCFMTNMGYANEKIQEEKDTSFITNVNLLDPFFEKLHTLEKTKKGKINIVHIGDSHVQADVFTDAIRQPLQEEFGNAGLGYTFPYNLIRTNGARNVKYTSNVAWQKHLVITNKLGDGVGVGGMVISQSDKDFILQLTVEDDYKFNSIKVLYPSDTLNYRLSIATELVKKTQAILPQNGVKYHKIRSGETLSSIARRYKVTVAQIKRENGMSSNMISAGRTLKIPTKTVKTNVASIAIDKNVETLPIQHKGYYSVYTGSKSLTNIMLLSDTTTTDYILNGFVLENKNAGVILHTIGVNGAKYSDYNKYPLFYKQLPILAPDLIILSLGTNESFGKISTSDFYDELEQCIQNIRKYNPNTSILITTPPPSLWRKQRLNTLAEEYTRKMMADTNLPVWDLYNYMGGINGVSAKGKYVHLINRDRIHYTEKGYRVQGELLVQDLMAAYKKHKAK